MSAVVITESEWLAELESLCPFTQDGEGLSIMEIADATGASRGCAQKRVKQMITSGRMEFAGFKTSTRMDGMPCRIPCYRIIKK